MTWKEFKERVEEQGVTDDMTILYIDVDDQEEVKVIVDEQAFGVE